MKRQLDYGTRDKLIDLLRASGDKKRTYFQMAKELNIELGTVADWLARLRQNLCTCKQPVHKGPCHAPLPLEIDSDSEAAVSSSKRLEIQPPPKPAQKAEAKAEAEEQGSDSGRADAQKLIATLTRERHKRKISVQRIADSFNQTKATIYHYEVGRSYPSLNKFCSLAKFLGFKVVLVPLEGAEAAEAYAKVEQETKPEQKPKVTQAPKIERKDRPKTTEAEAEAEVKEAQKSQVESKTREKGNSYVKFAFNKQRASISRKPIGVRLKRNEELSTIEKFLESKGVTKCPTPGQELVEFEEKNPLLFNKSTGKFGRKSAGEEGEAGEEEGKKEDEDPF